MSVSVFEIVGPIMIGPSSSHTAGMARIGMMTHRIVGENPVDIHLDLSPKMRTTYSGHRTDAALFGGVIGLTESDPDIRRAIDLAHERGVKTSVGFLESGKYPENFGGTATGHDSSDPFSLRPCKRDSCHEKSLAAGAGIWRYVCGTCF